MPTATDTLTIPTRHSALRLGTLMLAGLGATVTTKAIAGPSEPDAELIAICDRIVAVKQRLDALFAIRHTIDDERRTEPELDRLYAEEDRAIDAIGDLVPTTMTGAIAMARASVAIAPRDSDQTIRPDDDSEWLAWTVCEYLIEEGAVA